MKIGKIVELEDARSWTPTPEGVEYVDKSGARVFIPNILIVRLYEGLSGHYKNNGLDWEANCERMFEKQG
jgi:hypothetical protein